MDDTDPSGLQTITHGVEAVAFANEQMKITDLPNEILSKIMFHLSKRARFGVMASVSSTPTADIKNARLSCHKLGAAASRYLIERVTVDVSLRSLSRLETISEHPLFRHTVQAVEFRLAQYDNVFDNGVQGFMRFVRDHQQELAFRWRRSPEMVNKARDVADCWDAYLRVLQPEADTLLGSFDEEIGSIQDLTWDIRHAGVLEEGFYQYRSRLREQTSLLQDGFVARVSASMAKLTSAKHLKITDWDATAWSRQPQQLGLSFHLIDISSDSSIVKSLADSRRPFEFVQGTTLLSMIPDLICAGKDIESLDIQISPRVMLYTELTLSTSQEAELRSGLKKLEFFKFENYRSSVADPWNDAHAMRPLGQLLDACLISDNLESLFIDAKNRHPHPTESLFSPRTWPKLKSVHLEALPASAADLDVLTESLASRSPRGSLVLRSVNLYCGATWASILDMLRNRRIRVNLGRYQYGAEFEEDPALCDEVFRVNPCSYAIVCPSFAHYYVYWLGEQENMANPIVELPDQELRERLFGPVLDYWATMGVGYDFRGLM